MFCLKVFFLVVYVLFLLRLMLRKPEYAPFWIFPVFLFVWKMISLFYLEQGVYATELYRDTFTIGTDYIFWFEMSVFFLVAILSVRIIDENLIKESKISGFNKFFFDIALGIHCIVLLYLYLNVFLTGGAFTTPVTIFINNSRLPYINSLGSTFMFFLVFVTGIRRFCDKCNNKLCLFLFMLSILYMFMIGNKFSGIYQYVIYFFMPYFFQIAKEKKIKLQDILRIRHLLVSGLFCVFILGYVLIKYQNYEYSISAFDLLQKRILDMQSATLWGINEYIIRNDIFWFGSFEQLLIEINALFAGIDVFDGSIGLPKVMYLVSPSVVVDSYLESGLRFSGWFLAVSFLSLGYVGSMLMCVVTGIIFAVICASIKIAIENRNMILLGLSIYEYCHFYDYYRIGNYSLIFDVTNLCILLLLFFNVIALKGKSIHLTWR